MTSGRGPERGFVTGAPWPASPRWPNGERRVAWVPHEQQGAWLGPDGHARLYRGAGGAARWPMAPTGSPLLIGGVATT